MGNMKLAIIGGYVTYLMRKEKEKCLKETLVLGKKCSDLNLLKVFVVRDPRDLHNYLRIDIQSVEMLLELVRPESTIKSVRLRYPPHFQSTRSISFPGVLDKIQHVKNYFYFFSPTGIGENVEIFTRAQKETSN